MTTPSRSGPVALAAALLCGAAVGGCGPAPGGGASQHLYVPTQADRSVRVFAIGPGAGDAPVRTLAGPATTLVNPQSVMVDTLGALYVANYERDVTVYAPGAGGDVAPFFTFAVGAHPRSLSNPTDPTVVGWVTSSDQANTVVFVFQDAHQQNAGREVGRLPWPNLQGAWQWSPTGAYGCAANSSLLDGCKRVPTPGPPVGCPSPDLDDCLQGQGSGTRFELSGRAPGSRSTSLAFRADGAVVLTFTRPDTVATYRIEQATGGVAALTPLRAIVGPHTGLYQPSAVAFDAEGNLYVANTGLSSSDGSVTVYPPDADGDVAPSRTLAGLDHPFGLAIGK